MATISRGTRRTRSAAIAAALGALGCPGFAQLSLGFGEADEAPPPAQDPAVVLSAALACEDLPRNVVRALPWLVLEYAHLDWDFVLKEARRRGTQNRLGFIVGMAEQLGARAYGNEEKLTRLAEVEERLFDLRLDREDTLCQESLCESERTWLRANRGRDAALWNLLTDLDAREAR
jgi:hypothetical protein